MKHFFKFQYVFGICTLVVVGMGGCASVSELRFIQRTFTIEAPKELVWNGALHYFSVEKIPIFKVERDRGVIHARKTTRSSRIKDKYAECPKGYVQRNRRTTTIISVTESSKHMTKITIDLQFQGEYTASTIYGVNLGTKFYDCVSTGVGEREIFEEIFDYVSSRSNVPRVANVQDEQLNPVTVELRQVSTRDF